MTPSGLLMVLSEPPPGREDEFARWYDQHAAARLAVPGIQSAQRYACQAEPPTRMASYELLSTAVLDSPAYRALRSHRPPGEPEMIASLPLPLDRRVYEQLDQSARPDVADAAPCLLAVWMSVDDEDELHRWYVDEHVPMLLRAPGWLRVRRYHRIEGNGPDFLALHDLASPEVLDHPAAVEARSTPWRARVAASRTAYERRFYTRTHRY